MICKVKYCRLGEEEKETYAINIPESTVRSLNGKAMEEYIIDKLQESLGVPVFLYYWMFSYN